MKMFCISDDLDIAVGLKLTGIKSVILDEKSKIDEKIDEIVKDDSIGILIITNNIYQISNDKIDYIKNNRKLPLIVQI